MWVRTIIIIKKGSKYNIGFGVSVIVSEEVFSGYLIPISSFIVWVLVYLTSVSIFDGGP